MKAFTISCGDRFLKDKHSPMSLGGYYNNGLSLTDDIDDTKNWKTRSAAGQWLKKAHSRCDVRLAELLEDAKKYEAVAPLQQGYRNWSHNRNIEKTKDVTECKENLNDCKVIEIDIERPNFTCSTKPKYRFAGTGGMPITTVHISKHTCDLCGVILKNIPFTTIGHKQIKVCVPCLKLRQESIDAAFDSMDEDIRTELTNNYLLNNI